MQKLIFSVIFIFMIFMAKAQVLINLLPQLGLQVKSQLWSISMINTGNEILNVKLDMTLTDISTGQIVLSGSSRFFSLPRGAKQIQMSDLVPIQYNVLNSIYNINSNPDGFLPVGAFVVCFSVLKQTGDAFEKVSEECETIVVEPASPPFLNSPDDQAEIDQNRPLFIWLPPSPLSLFSSLSYELKLVEVNHNQIPSDAIQNNFPVLNQTYIYNSTLQYPFSLQPLDTARLYAWQVKALNNRLPVSNSEIFTFKLRRQQNSTVPETNIYVKVKGLGEVPLTVCTGILRYEYVNTYNNAVIRLALTDITTKVNQKISIAEDHQEVFYGQNFLHLDLTGRNALKNNHIYQLEVSGAKGEEQAVKFIYKKAD